MSVMLNEYLNDELIKNISGCLFIGYKSSHLISKVNILCSIKKGTYLRKLPFRSFYRK